ncbi:MAG: hypothetical protein VB835_11900, partial [Pirellulales bacterium]
SLAGRLASAESTDEARIRLLYETCYARRPSPSESKRLLSFLRGNRWPAICHAVLSSNEFVYLK